MSTSSIRLSLRTDRALVRGSARSTRYLLVSLAAPYVEANTERLPLNVGIVLDRSGSMDGDDKFGLARQAVEQSLGMLRPQDQFSLVVFDTEVTTIMPLTPATPQARRDALRRLHDVGPRGGTDLHGGWMAGGAELLRAVAQSAPPTTAAGGTSGSAVNRVLLLTDGQANHGITEPLALQSAATAFRMQGVSTSTFGVGTDFDERLLRDIAHEGGGQFYFIEGATQIADLLTSELGEALEVVRQNAELRITMPEGVHPDLLNRYRNVAGRTSRELQVALGDLTSGQELQVVVGLTFPEDREGTVATVGVEFGVNDGGKRAERDGFVSEIRQEMVWQYASHNANDICPRDVVVDREVAELYAARARAQATEANRNGDFRLARRLLEKTAAKIREYANNDAVLIGLWRGLLAEVEMFSMGTMSAINQKLAFYSANARSRNRDVQGKVRRQ